MKTWIFALATLAISVFSTNVIAQDWKKVSGLLTQVSAVDSDTAWGVNVNGNVYRSSDGGASWQKVSGLLTQVSAVDSDTAWGVNVNGNVYHSSNGGASWQKVAGLLIQVSAVDSVTAWGVNVNGNVYRSSNGGASWQKVAGLLTQVSAVDSDTAWGVNVNGNVYRSSNGGASWQKVAGLLTHVSAVDSDKAWGVNVNDNVYRSDNRGESWTRVRGNLKQVSALSFESAWGVDARDQVFTTSASTAASASSAAQAGSFAQSVKDALTKYNATPQYIDLPHTTLWDIAVSGLVEDHINGMAVLRDRTGDRYVFNYPSVQSEYGNILFTKVNDDWHRISVALGEEGWPSGMQATDDVLAVAMPTKSGTGKQIAVYKVSGTNLEQKAVINITGKFDDAETVGISRTSSGGYILLTRNTLWKADSNFDFYQADSFDDDIRFGEAGLALLYDDESSKMVVLSLGTDLDSGSFNYAAYSLEIVESSGTNAWFEGKIELLHEGKLLAPSNHSGSAASLRWGGTAIYDKSTNTVDIFAAPKRPDAVGYASNALKWSWDIVSPKMDKFTVSNLKIKCITTTEAGEDEIYLKLNSGRRLPEGTNEWHDINNGETWDVAETFESNSEITISIMEYDDASGDDLIGTINVGKAPGSFEKQLTGDGGDYQVNYSVDVN